MPTYISKEAAVNDFLDACRQLSYYNGVSSGTAAELVAHSRALVRYKELLSIVTELNLVPAD